MTIEVRYSASHAPAVQIRYVDTFIDRNGGRRYYCRRGKGARWVLRVGLAHPNLKRPMPGRYTQIGSSS